MPLIDLRLSRGVTVALLALAFLIGPTRLESSTQRVANTREAGLFRTTTVVNLGALIGPSVRFVPTALNDKGQIVGYDNRTLPNGNAGSAYLINPDGTLGALDGSGTTSGFSIPLAISDNGNTVAGVANGGMYNAPGIVVWHLLGGARSRQIYRHLAGYNDPFLPLVTGIANGNVPVGGMVSYGSTSYSVTPFKQAGCVLSDFSANAANDTGTIVGSAGGYGAIDTLSDCATYLPGLPRPANTSTSFIAENANGALLGVLQGPAAPAFGAYYLIANTGVSLPLPTRPLAPAFGAGHLGVGNTYVRIPLPPTFSSATYFVQAVALSNRNAVVGNVSSQAPPFDPVAPFLYANGRSIDVNVLLPVNSGWRLVTAAGIDSAGEIIGTGYFNGIFQGYALHP